jgi:hypothetical protein
MGFVLLSHTNLFNLQSVISVGTITCSCYCKLVTVGIRNQSDTSGVRMFFCFTTKLAVVEVMLTIIRCKIGLKLKLRRGNCIGNT